MKQLYSPVLCVSHIQGVIAGNETVLAIRCLHMQWVTQQLHGSYQILFNFACCCRSCLHLNLFASSKQTFCSCHPETVIGITGEK